MTIWVDAPLPPAIALWISAKYAVTAVAVREIGLGDASGRAIFQAGRSAGAVQSSFCTTTSFWSACTSNN